MPGASHAMLSLTRVLAPPLATEPPDSVAVEVVAHAGGQRQLRADRMVQHRLLVAERLHELMDPAVSDQQEHVTSHLELPGYPRLEQRIVQLDRVDSHPRRHQPAGPQVPPPLPEYA